LAHTEALLELAAFSALGALDGSDREAFEKHLLEGCAECAAAREAWERDVSVLSFSVAAVEPSPGLRARLLEGRGPRRAPAAAAGASRGMGWLALAASILLAAVALDDLAQIRSARD